MAKISAGLPSADLNVDKDLDVGGTLTINEFKYDNSPDYYSFSSTSATLFRCSASGTITSVATSDTTTYAGAGFLWYCIGNEAQYDMIRWYEFIKAGTYNITIEVGTETNRGIAHLYIDGTAHGTQDCYSVASATRVMKTFSNVEITTSKKHNIDIRVDTKNLSAINYGMSINRITFVPSS